MAKVQLAIVLFIISFTGCQALVSGSNEEQFSRPNAMQGSFHGRIIGFHYLGLRPNEKEDEVIFLDVPSEKRARLIQDLTALNIKLDEGGNFDFIAEVKGRLSAVQHTDSSKECYVPEEVLDSSVTRCIVVESFRSIGW